MQWDKVKNILIAILLTINLFLLGNLAVRGWQSHRRTSELEANLRTLVSARGMQLDTAFSFPEDITLPELSLDRSRADEEKVAAAMLGEHAERTEQEDGTVCFESDRGTLEWQADGNVQADYTLTESAPTSASEALEQARRLCSRWGFQAEQPADGGGHGSYANRLGRRLPAQSAADTGLFAGDGSSLVGLWSFGTPYTTANGISITCSADALLQFAAESGETGKIESMTAGYRMQTDSSRRIRLTPTWKIDTETGEYLVDCDKKTIIGEEN
ncbi:MAG: hypothetical protein ACLT4C_01560 [Butyricicoccus sp.]